MAALIVSNRIQPPPGYRKPYSAMSVYKPWNWAPGLSPGNQLLGSAFGIAISAVPGDLATMALVGPNGVSYLFQFVYNASVWNQGIKIPLPLSGASTPAQVAAAIVSVLNAGTATLFGGTSIVLPWSAVLTSASALNVNFTVPGQIGSSTSPAGVTISVSNQYGTNSIRAIPFPAMAGYVGGFLPGI